MKTDPGEVFCAHGCGLPATMNVGGEDLCNECGHRMQSVQHDYDDEALASMGLWEHKHEKKKEDRHGTE